MVTLIQMIGLFLFMFSGVFLVMYLASKKDVYIIACFGLLAVSLLMSI